MARDVLIPDPLDTIQEYHRFHHHDLPELSDSELTDESNMLKSVLLGLPPQHWCRERVAAIEVELKKRRGNTGLENKKRPKLGPTGVIPL